MQQDGGDCCWMVSADEPHENLEDTSTLGPSPADNALENHPDDDQTDSIDTSEDSSVDDALEYNPCGVATAYRFYSVQAQTEREYHLK